MYPKDDDFSRLFLVPLVKRQGKSPISYIYISQYKHVTMFVVKAILEKMGRPFENSVLRYAGEEVLLDPFDKGIRKAVPVTGRGGL
jgi:hypothetical protein